MTSIRVQYNKGASYLVQTETTLTEKTKAPLEVPYLVMIRGLSTSNIQFENLCGDFVLCFLMAVAFWEFNRGWLRWIRSKASKRRENESHT